MTRNDDKLHTVEIPREDWGKALLTIGECLHNEPARVWVEGLELGNQPVADGLTLLGLSLVEKGSFADAIEVSLGDHRRHAITHLIRHPERLHVQEDDHGKTLCVWVKGTDGLETLIYFEHGHAPAPGVRSLKLASKKV